MRIQKLAYLYREKEQDIRYYHRNYQGPTYGVVATFVKSFFKPARGQLKVTVNQVIEEV
ncbi:MAG: hypothetical protein GWN18_19415, partial [Thermoplasmata archaeon]|nr:hypothetical protein [Thermoplasmata archaeon]NIS14318.1 hypothetical protein [Thermoplasmata archaeon]NIS22140.1 hypothetical protein [Thermoplasmata archaeon]NIT80022.1 hypothetical protein [Thermoplasmata archaeon]NIU51156.1 hypothetical protein [Thermoplasmata archaeon]